MVSRWYVLMSKPGKEEVLLKQLESQGYDIFLPYLAPPLAKTRKIPVRAYFPGYLFIRLDLDKDSLSTFQWMPHTEGLVCFGTKPAFVPDHLVEAIRRHIRQLGGSGEAESQPVAISANQPFPEHATYAGIFNPELSSEDRVRELLRMLRGESVAPAAND